MTVREVDTMSEEGAKDYLRHLIERLEEAADNGLWGNENWEYALEMNEEE